MSSPFRFLGEEVKTSNMFLMNSTLQYPFEQAQRWRYQVFLSPKVSTEAHTSLLSPENNTKHEHHHHLEVTERLTPASQAFLKSLTEARVGGQVGETKRASAPFGVSVSRRRRAPMIPWERSTSRCSSRSSTPSSPIGAVARERRVGVGWGGGPKVQR